MAVMGIAGELAGENCVGPASFQTNFIDWLYRLTEKEISEKLKLNDGRQKCNLNVLWI